MKNPGFLSLALMIAALAHSPLAHSQPSHAAEHPGLILTRAGVEQIRAELGAVPLFDATLRSVREEVDAEIALGIDTPIPRDFSGGYTHERHRQNFLIAEKAGMLFQILEDEQYARYVRDMLFQYEAMYQDLPLHPQERSYARGKLFWQCLNDANWLVYMSQAYDAIHDWLSPRERTQLEENLFRPFADFISIGNPQFFNRVHNHSTWGAAAVGMIGLVMEDDELVQRALYGIQDDSSVAGARDDDGGFIREEGQQVGFLANIDEPFSPDGYYTEGPYYQRYAMYPFLIFAVGLENARPELGIFEYKDGVLLRSVDALLNLADADGEFFPLNDAQKGMSWHSRELVTAVDVAYHFGGSNPQLLSIAGQQGQVLLNDAGIAVALGIRDGATRPFAKRSLNLADGVNGNQGGVAILRHGDEELALVFKYSAQGLSHGHYDKLSFSLFEQGEEVLQDYGMARFVNIEQKGGGNYLEENTSWAKQTIAHNTLTQNETSHFAGSYEIGSRHHSELHFFDATKDAIKVVSAREANAYPGTEMLRTMAMIKEETFDKPMVLDILKVNSAEANQYDLPFYYLGQAITTNFEFAAEDELRALGAANGYQHLFLEASGAPASANSKFTWLGSRGFYTLTSATETRDELLFTRLGANDPEFNLRRDPALLIRRNGVGDTVFASVLEPHGNYSPVSEIAASANSSIVELRVVHDSDNYTAVTFEDTGGQTRIFIVSNTNASASAGHQLEVDGETFAWTGPYSYADFD